MDKWLELMNFYLITLSEGALTSDDFTPDRLAAAYAESPGTGPREMEASARKLVLEFQAQKQDTELKNEVARRGHSPRLRSGPAEWPAEAKRPANAGSGEKQELPNGPIPVPLPDLSVQL
jgi:hypothetical protein